MKRLFLVVISLVWISQFSVSSAEMLPVKGSHDYPSFTLGAPFFDEECNGLAIPLEGESHGQVTHLGKFSEWSDVTFCITGDQPGSSYGTSTWTAANGDEIFFEFTGQDRPRGEGEAFVIADYESIIQGGTGRFQDASGIIYTEQFRPDPQDGTGGAFNTILEGSMISSVGSVRSTHVVPEPTSMSLVVGAAWGAAGFLRRRNRAC